MFYRKAIFQIILLCLPFLLVAQFAVYTPFSASPMYLNPAFNGVFQENYRLSVQYKNQGFNYLRENSYQDLFFEGEIRFNAFGKDSWALGLHLDDSMAGTAGYKVSNANINAAYLKKLSFNQKTKGSHYLSVGSQAGAGQRKIAGDRLVFPEDLDSETGEIKPLNSGNWTGLNRNYLNLHAGLVYYYIVQGKYNMTAGIAAENLNKATISLLDGDNEIQKIKWNVSLSGALKLKNSISIHPSFILQKQGLFSSLLTGVSMGIDFTDSSDFSLLSGLWLRSFSQNNEWDAGSIGISSMLGFDKLKIGLALNFSLNEIRALDNAYRSMEISTIYTFGQLKNTNNIVCPKM